MTNIEIVHNPFLVQTTFKIDGREPGENSQFSEFKTQRLQMWVENFFDVIKEIFNGTTKFNIHFKGVPADCADFEQEVEKFNKKGMQIELTCERVEGAETRLDKVSKMINEVKANPLFEEYFESNSFLKEKISQTLDKDFNVYVIATMSSGKSTLINAMLGCSLLPALNEATTATIATIYDNDNEYAGEYNFKCLNAKNQVVIDEDVDVSNKESAKESSMKIAEWNKSTDISNINIYGNILSFTERENVRLVLTDTPGPNNSQNEEHALTTMRFIKDSDRNPLILYVLNATQMGIKDDKRLLKEIAEVVNKGGKQNKDRFIFVLNKVDVFDPERGESPFDAIEKAKIYLRNNGIVNPQVYPVSAYLTLLLRTNKLNPELLTRNDRHNLIRLKDLFEEEDSMDLVQYMPLTSKQKAMLDNKNLDTVLYRSGMPALEVVIDDYIERYSFPNRLTRAQQGLSQLIEQSVDTAEIQKALEVNEEELNQISKVLSHLAEQQQKGLETDGYISSLKTKKKELPIEAMNIFHKQLSKIDAFLSDLEPEFKGKGNKNDAEKKIMDLENTLRDFYNGMIIDLEKAIKESQNQVKEEMSEAYNNYLIQLFNDVDKLDMPVLKGLKKQALSFKYSLGNNEVKIKSRLKKVGTVSDATWYNPFTWFKKKDVYRQYHEEIVDLEEIWKVREQKIRSNLKQVVNSAIKQAEKNNINIINTYANFMKQQFEDRFLALMVDIQHKIDNKEQREKAIQKANSDLKEIESLKQELSILIAV